MFICTALACPTVSSSQRKRPQLAGVPMSMSGEMYCTVGKKPSPKTWNFSTSKGMDEVARRRMKRKKRGGSISMVATGSVLLVRTAKVSQMGLPASVNTWPSLTCNSKFLRKSS